MKGLIGELLQALQDKSKPKQQSKSKKTNTKGGKKK